MNVEEKPRAAERRERSAPGTARPALRAMLEATSVALVGASPRPGSFGQRMIDQVGRSPAGPGIYLVNPRYRQIGDQPCYPSLADLPEPADLVLLGVPDAALERQLSLAADGGCRAAVIFGNAHEEPASLLGPGRPGASGNPDRSQLCTSNFSPGDITGPGGIADPAGTGRPVLRQRLAAIARGAGMELCGAGCMGFVNVARGLRAIGYVEPDQLPAGPVALVTHSGSVFSAMLRSRRAIGFTLAVSSGQELVTTAAAYLEYALSLPETRVLALVLEAMREPGRLQAALTTAAARDIPVVLLTVGGSASGRTMVAAHSGALAAQDGGWEALADAYGVHRAGDLAEMADTLELFAIGRRAQPPAARQADAPASHPTQPSITTAAEPSITPAQPPITAAQPPIAIAQPPITAAQPFAGGGETGVRSPWKVTEPRFHPPGAGLREAAGRTGIATVHDSGLERAHTADLADELGVPYASIGEPTLARLARLLDPGLRPANPLDMWGTGGDAQRQLTESLVALAEDPAVTAVALAVDLVSEFDGDRSYPGALLAAAARTAKPVAVLASLASAIDPEVAGELRRAGIPVLEGTRTGLLALRHLLAHADRANRAALADPAPPPGQTAHPPPAGRADHAPRPGQAAHAPPAALAHPTPPAGQTAHAPPAAPGGGREAEGEPGDSPPSRPLPAEVRRARGAALLAAGQAAGEPLLGLLREYGIAAARTVRAASTEEVQAAASMIGFPVVLKTDNPEISHKSDVGGVLLGISGPAELAAAYRDLSARLGPRALVCETVPPGVELALGIARDADLGPLIVVGAGGVLVELLADRAVALPPVDENRARRLVARLRAGRLLAGVRGAAPADTGAVIRAITGLSSLAVELGDHLEALDVNPLICGPSGAIAVDALAIPRISD